MVRVIGVTGEELEMDVYDIDPTQIRKNEKGIIESIVLTDGITATDFTKMVCSGKIVEVDYKTIPERHISQCAKERWMKK